MQPITRVLCLLCTALLTACDPAPPASIAQQPESTMPASSPDTKPDASAPQTPRNPQVQAHAFLADMSRDAYFPPKLVDQGKAVLNELCLAIEAKPPQNLDELYALTHAATLRFNELAEAFEAAGSEIETAAREDIGADMAFIAQAYGFAQADTEELIAPRDW